MQCQGLHNTSSHILTPISSTVSIQVNRTTPTCVYSRFLWNLVEGCSSYDVITSWPNVTELFENPSVASRLTRFLLPFLGLLTGQLCTNCAHAWDLAVASVGGGVCERGHSILVRNSRRTLSRLRDTVRSLSRKLLVFIRIQTRQLKNYHELHYTRGRSISKVKICHSSLTLDSSGK